jgi:hypothetical protein
MNIDAHSIALRGQIIGMAINIEEKINDLILLLLELKTNERKALSENSGSFSFKNKIDLLFDLGILLKDEYIDFLLLSEIRNQFAHRINCNAYSEITDEIKKKLKKQSNLTNKAETELDLRNAVSILYAKCSEIITLKVESARHNFEENEKTFTDSIEYLNYFIDCLTAVLVIVKERFLVEEQDSFEIHAFKHETSDLLMNALIEITDTKKHNDLYEKYLSAMNQAKIAKLLKTKPEKIKLIKKQFEN